MKVLMQGRIGLMEVGGGDKVQIENTAIELRKMGVEVDIVTERISNYSKYDLVHVFQLDWTPESYFYIRDAKLAGKPVVLSPIHHAVKDVAAFDENCAYGFRRISKLLFKDQHHRDTFKNIYKSIFDPRKLPSTIYSITKGLKKMHLESLSASDIVLVQTDLEAADLKNTYRVEFEWKKVPNGVGDVFINPKNVRNYFDFQNYIVCVGRIEPRKNQLNILKSVEKLRDETNQDLQLVFIGSKSIQKHIEYIYWFDQFIKNKKWIHHLEKVEYSNMPSIYSYAKVCVSASWFETTGLTLLEALFCGCNGVASGDRVKEYLGDYISYCNPADQNSIKEAIYKELNSPNRTIPEEWTRTYTWKNSAIHTFQAYNSVLSKRNL